MLAFVNIRILFIKHFPIRLKITQLQKVRFFWVNELKLSHVEFFFHFKCVDANASELLCNCYVSKYRTLFISF